MKRYAIYAAITLAAAIAGFFFWMFYDAVCNHTTTLSEATSFFCIKNY